MEGGPAPGIEWDAVRALLAREARTPMGRERALAAEPFVDVAAVRAALEDTTQARRALRATGPPPLDDLPDIRPFLTRCRVAGAALEGPELVEILTVVDADPRLRAWGERVRVGAPALAARTAALPPLRDLGDRLRAALTEDGGLRDEASPRLRALRRELRERRRRLVGELERRLAGPDADRLFADRYVTVRHGRYVLPVRAEARTRVRGIVHDRSQSGQTLFVEPADVVDANNELVQLAREEAAEAARILAALTAAVRARLDALEALVATVAELDWIAARARLAERMAATAPRVDAEGPVRLRAARHPLLVAQQWEDPTRPVVPVDLDLTPERPVLVVTGPNAGGKTIALTTLALHVLMAQTGCHLPAAEGSQVPVFAAVHAIIGDDQSVAANLSTFSAFVTRVREILARADRRALVLLDELGAGTDPDEGAALAQALLEALAERGALVMATTHLEPLKVFAATHPLARNASVEFDTTHLAPTYRLVYDRPGPSYALTIAARLGLPPAVVARAQAHRTAHAARLAELLEGLDARARAERERLLALERREQELAARLAAARAAELAAEARAREVVEQARREASTLLAEVRRAVAAEWERLRRSERSRRDLAEARRRLAEAARAVTPGPPAPASEEQAALVPGVPVVAEHLGLQGRLVDVAGGTATVQAGRVTVRLPLSALRPAGAQAGTPPAPTGRRGAHRPEPGPHPARAVPGELLLLGRTTDEARTLVEQYLDDAFLAGLPAVRLVHGKGTGALRKAVRDLLATHPLVASFRDGEPAEGGTGATVAALVTREGTIG